jgi:hypothetical protein
MRYLLLLLLLTSCTTIRFRGEYILPDHHTIGGLSGIDYDAASDTYYLISDDRSNNAPARFYTAKIRITSRIEVVNITGVKTLLQRDGQPYAPKTVDPEAIRYKSGVLVWSSEGERLDSILINPSINIITTAGKYIDTFPLPANLQMQHIARGPQRNAVLEGLTFTGETLFASLERPLYEDGEDIRIYEFKNRINTRQYKYRPDSACGVTDILALKRRKLLVTERSYNGKFSIKVFTVRLSHKKRLLIDMNKLPITIDNIEGATWGPRLANGHRSLIFLSDNNFEPSEKTQFLLFEFR